MVALHAPAHPVRVAAGRALRRRWDDGGASRAYGSMSGGGSSYNPGTAIPWVGAYWASDPRWSIGKPLPGGDVTAWRDDSAMAVDLNGPSTPRPVLVGSVATLNGQPGVRTTQAANSWIQVNGGAAAPAAPVTIVQIFSIDIAAVSFNSVTAVSGSLIFVGAGGSQVFGYAGVTPLGPPDTGLGAKAVRYLANGAASIVTVNGVTAGPGTDTGVGGFTTQRVIGGDTSALQSASIAAAFTGFYAGDVTTDPGWTAFKAWALSTYGAVLT